MIPGDGRGCDGRRRERHRNGQLAHMFPLSMRSQFEPREHIMRAPVAAQVCDCALLLLKSISRSDVTKKVKLLAFDKAMLPKRREYLNNGRPALGINVHAAARRGNWTLPASDHLHALNDDACPAKNADFPRPGLKAGPRTGGLDVNIHPFERRDEPPATASVACQAQVLAGPSTGRQIANDVAIA